MADGRRGHHFVHGMKEPRLPDDEIVELYRELRDSTLVGLRANCSGTTVLHVLHRTGHGHLVNHDHGGTPKPYKRLLLTDGQIVERYDAGASIRSLRDASGATYERIKRILLANGRTIRSAVTQRRMDRG